MRKFIRQQEFNISLLKHGIIINPIDVWRTAQVLCYDEYGYPVLASKDDFTSALKSIGYENSGCDYDSDKFHLADEFFISHYLCSDGDLYVNGSS